MGEELGLIDARGISTSDDTVEREVVRREVGDKIFHLVDIDGIVWMA